MNEQLLNAWMKQVKVVVQGYPRSSPVRTLFRTIELMARCLRSEMAEKDRLRMELNAANHRIYELGCKLAPRAYDKRGQNVDVEG